MEFPTYTLSITALAINDCRHLIRGSNRLAPSRGKGERKQQSLHCHIITSKSHTLMFCTLHTHVNVHVCANCSNTMHKLKAGFCMPQLMLYDTIPIIQLYPGVKFSTNFSETLIFPGLYSLLSHILSVASQGCSTCAIQQRGYNSSCHVSCHVI